MQRPLGMATHPDALCFVPLFCRVADAAAAAAAAAAPGRPPTPLPVAPPDYEHDDHLDDSFDKPIFMDYARANTPPDAPLPPCADQPPALVLTRSTSEGSSLDSSTTTSPRFACGTPPWLLQQRAARRARLLAAGLPVAA
jgi:hypothetical protein